METRFDWRLLRRASYEMGMLFIARSPPEHDEAVKHLSRSFELHTAGKGRKDQMEHMRVGNALAGDGCTPFVTFCAFTARRKKQEKTKTKGASPRYNTCCFSRCRH